MMGIKRKLPRKELNASLSPGESFLRATAAMVAFEATVIERDIKENNLANKNGPDA